MSNDESPMKRRLLALAGAAVLALGTGATAGCGDDNNDSEEAGQEAEDAGNAIEGAAEDAGNEIEGAADDVDTDQAAEDIENAAEDAGGEIEDAANDAGGEIEDATNDEGEEGGDEDPSSNP
jgi:hypothetical protein